MQMAQTRAGGFSLQVTHNIIIYGTTPTSSAQTYPCHYSMLLLLLSTRDSNDYVDVCHPRKLDTYSANLNQDYNAIVM